MNINDNKFFWLWLPVLWMGVQILVEIFVPLDIRHVIHSEHGPHELIQWLMIVSCLIISLTILWRMDRANKWLVAWISLAALCCLYVSIEEISWGQTFVKWATPEFWQNVNYQEETNLHNTSKWLNQKPRLLLELGGMLVGGLIIPLLLIFKPGWMPKRFTVIYPPKTVIVTALVYAAFKLVNQVSRHMLDLNPFARPSEVEELYLFYFVFLYLLTMKARLTPEK